MSETGLSCPELNIPTSPTTPRLTLQHHESFGHHLPLQVIRPIARQLIRIIPTPYSHHIIHNIYQSQELRSAFRPAFNPSLHIFDRNRNGSQSPLLGWLRYAHTLDSQVYPCVYSLSSQVSPSASGNSALKCVQFSNAKPFGHTPCTPALAAPSATGCPVSRTHKCVSLERPETDFLRRGGGETRES